MVHDIGGREGLEPASEQKEIASGFASAWSMKLLGGRNPVPIVNVMRFRDGKIGEFWNHRHDIDTAAGNLG